MHRWFVLGAIQFCVAQWATVHGYQATTRRVGASRRVFQLPTNFIFRICRHHSLDGLIICAKSDSMSAFESHTLSLLIVMLRDEQTAC